MLSHRRSIFQCLKTDGRFFALLSMTRAIPAERCFDKLSMTKSVLGSGRPFGKLRVTKEELSCRLQAEQPEIFFKANIAKFLDT